MSEVRYCGTGGALVKPDDPSNESILSAVPAFGGIDVSWTYPGINPEALAHTILYRNTADDFASASIHARVSGSFFFDSSKEEAPTRYYYWIKHLSINGTLFPEIGPATAVARLPIAEVIEGLTAEIDSGFLALSLRTKIESISTLRQNIEDEIAARMAELSLVSQLFEEVRAHSEQSRVLLNEERTQRESEIAIVVESLNGVYAELLAGVDAERVRTETLRNEAIERFVAIESNVDATIDRMGVVESNLLGPETLNGTVANRIKAEREARIASLGSETDARVVAVQAEADARIDAIHAEAEARGAGFFEVRKELQTESEILLSQMGVLAASYDSSRSAMYSLEEVRVSESVATAVRIDGMEVVVEDNKAAITEEIRVRSDSQSAMATSISILSAKLDALPTFGNGFELGVEFDRWETTPGHTLTATSSDAFSGDQAGLLSSSATDIPISSVPFGTYIAMASGTGDAFAGRRLRIGFASKAVAGGSLEYGIGYATSDGWFSGWQLHSPESLWSVQESLIDVPDTPGLTHYIVLWGDTSGSGGEVLLDRLLVEVANTEIPEITAEIENVQQALVDSEKALTEDITNLKSIYDGQISVIQNTQSTLSTSTEALATDVQTLTVATGDNAADIQTEKTVRANQDAALAESVTDLWAGVENTQGQITQESSARAEEEYFAGLIQNVIQANTTTSAASLVSIKEVVTEKDAVMARNVEGIEGRVGQAEGDVRDIMQLNISPDSVLATRFSAVEGRVGQAEGSIENIENLEIAADSVLATRLSTIDGKIENSEGAITAIELLEISPDSVLASTLTGLAGRVGEAEGDITSITNLTIDGTSVLASTLTSLDGRVESSEGSIKAIEDLTVAPDSVLATTIDAIEGRVETAEGGIEAITTLAIDPTSVLATKLETMEGKIGTTEGNVSDLVNLTVGEETVIATRFSELDGRVGKTEGNITRAEQLKVEDDRIRGFISDVLSAATESSAAAYKSITDVVVEKDEVVGSRLFEIDGEVRSSKGKIQELDTLLVTGDEAVITRLESAEATVGESKGLIQDILYLRLTEDMALFQKFETIEGNVGDNYAAVNDILELKIDETSALFNRFKTIDIEVENANTAIIDAVNLSVTSNEVLINRIDEVVGSVSDASGRISDIETLEISADSVLASKLSAIEAQVGESTAGIRDIKYLNLEEDSALITTLNQVQADIGSSAADIKNIKHIELNDGNTLAQQFNTIDVAFEGVETRYRDVVNMNLDPTSNIAIRFEELGTAESSIYDIMEMNVDNISGSQLYQRIIGIENETSKVQLKAASYSGIIVQNGSFSTGELDNWNGWSSVTVTRRDEAAATNAIRTQPSEYSASFPNTGHAAYRDLITDKTPVTAGEDYTFRISYAGGGSGISLRIQVYVQWFNLGGYVGGSLVLDETTNYTSWSTSDIGKATAPEGATEGRVLVRRVANGSGTLFVTDVRGNIVGEALGSLFTAKVEENGLVGGFGVYNNGEFVEAGFDVDRFWVGRTANNKRKPFIIENGEVFMDEAVINTLTFNKLKADDGSFVVQNGKVRGDLIEATNLVVKESSTFTGVAQSNNFSPGTRGWKLDPINNTGEINFPISFGSITGEGTPEAGATRNAYSGFWGGSRVYAPGDIVIYKGNGWIAKQVHTSNTTNRPPEVSTEYSSTWSIHTVKGDAPVVSSNGNGTYDITGDNGTITISDGANAPIPTVTSIGGGSYRVNDGAGNTVTVSDGYSPQKGIDYFDGTTGNYHSWVYREGASRPATPSGGSFNGTTESMPSGWIDVPPSNPSNIVWVSKATYKQYAASHSNHPAWYRVINWSYPGKFYERGPEGARGYTGARGYRGYTGPAGEDGNPTYTWIAYSPYASGSSLTATPQSNTAYIGIAVNKSTPLNPSPSSDDYVWSKYKGDDGVAGEKGADGATTYTWIKYADNAYGSSGFSDSPTGKAYIGIAYNKASASESNNRYDYTWAKIQGEQGPKGNTGNTGSTGPKGDRGYRGYRGYTGDSSASTVYAYKDSSAVNSNIDTSITYGTWGEVPNSTWSNTPPTTGNYVVWETVGKKADGNNKYFWSKPVVSSRHWIKPNQTKLDGNKIYTGDAYVDTLQIKGNAVTIPSAVSAGASIDTKGVWTDAIAYNFDPQGGAVIFQFGISYYAFSTVYSAGATAVAHVNARLVINGNVVKTFNNIDKSTKYNSSGSSSSSTSVTGNWASAHRHPGWSGSQWIKLQVYGGGSRWASASNRFLISLSAKR